MTAMDAGLVLLLMWLNISPIFGVSSPSSLEKIHNVVFALVIFFVIHVQISHLCCRRED